MTYYIPTLIVAAPNLMWRQRRERRINNGNRERERRRVNDDNADRFRQNQYPELSSRGNAYHPSLQAPQK
jgi:hypothetical protein